MNTITGIENNQNKDYNTLKIRIFAALHNNFVNACINFNEIIQPLIWLLDSKCHGEFF